MKSWIKLDNAAKIFPSVSSKYRSNMFRIAFSLTETVDKDVLQEALNLSIMRFKVFKIRLKSGLFWNYFDENKKMPEVVKEDPFILEPLEKYKSKGYLFRVTYFENKIGIEMFHSLTDGFGASQFLKAILYEYLVLKGYDIDAEGKILFDLESAFEENEDSFQRLYEDHCKTDYKENKASHFKGTMYSDNYIGLITGIVPKNNFKELLAKFDCSYTQLIVGTLNYVASQNMKMLKKKERPFQVFVPVDLRRKFPTKSLRNFSMIVKTSMKLDRNKTLEDYIKESKEQLIEGLRDENLLPRVLGNVKLEKNFILRIVPLFIKKIAFKIGYNRMSTVANSICISNLGEIDLPNDMKKYVTKVTFSNGVSKEAPINMGVTYYDDKIYMTFSSSILERDFQRTFFRVLSDLGLDITIENNDLEE